LSNEVFSGDIDPEIAELMEIDEAEEMTPGFDDLFNDGTPVKQQPDKVDLSKQSFNPVTKLSEDRTNPLFSSKEFYKAVLSGEGVPSKRVHALLSQFLNTTDPKD